MYTNTSKFRVNGKYGLFTIPKGILGEAGWKPGDLIGFWGLDKKVIHIEKISKEYFNTLNIERKPEGPELWDGKTAERCLDAILNFKEE